MIIEESKEIESELYIYRVISELISWSLVCLNTSKEYKLLGQLSWYWRMIYWFQQNFWTTEELFKCLGFLKKRLNISFNSSTYFDIQKLWQRFHCIVSWKSTLCKKFTKSLFEINIGRIIEKYCETGLVEYKNCDKFSRSEHSPEIIDLLRENAAEDTKMSIGRRSSQVGLDRSIKWRISQKDLVLKAYKDQIAQELKPFQRTQSTFRHKNFLDE